MTNVEDVESHVMFLELFVWFGRFGKFMCSRGVKRKHPLLFSYRLFSRPGHMYLLSDYV